MDRYLVEAQSLIKFKSNVENQYGKVRYADYQEISGLKRGDIEKSRKFLTEAREYAKNTEQNRAAEQQWQNMLDQLDALETSWKNGTIATANHTQENYDKTAELTKAKLNELFGEVRPPSVGGSSDKGATDTPITVQSVLGLGGIEKSGSSVSGGGKIDYSLDAEKFRAGLRTAAFAPQVVLRAPIAKKETQKKPPRTPEQVRDGNQAFITKHKSDIDAALISITDITKKTEIEGYINTPNFKHINALQRIVGTSEDGDFRTKTLDALKKYVATLATKGAKKDEAPAKKDEAPAKKDEAPAKKDEAPAKKDEAPAKKDEAPAKKDEAPAKKDEAPAKKDEAPAKKDEAPAKKDEAPAKKDEAPQAQASAPQAQASAPQAQASAPQAQASGTRPDDILPLGIRYPAPNSPKLAQKTATEKLRDAMTEVDDYLKKNGYKKQENGTYTNNDGDFTVEIHPNGTAEFTRSVGRAFGNWELNTKEKRDMLELGNIFAGKTK